MTSFDFLNFSMGGDNQHIIFWSFIFKNIFWIVEFTQLSSFIIFLFHGTNLNHGQRKLVALSNFIYQNYHLRHSRNLLYYLQLIIHHLQVILQEHSSRLKLIIKTLLQIKTRITFQIQITIHSYIQNIIFYCKNIIKTITKNNLSWFKMK